MPNKKTKIKQSEQLTEDPLLLAGEVAQRSSLVSIEMISGAFGRKEGKIESKGLDIHSHQDFSRVGERLAATVHFAVMLNPPFVDDAENSKDAIRVEGDFKLVYIIRDLDSIPEPAFERFAKINGVYNSWPYWREFVHSAISRMNFPGLVMPVLTIGRAIMLAGFGQSPRPKSDRQT
ncbi:MAG: hypothetical protein JSR77_18615 [Planctomycetes bacterium]|nr:hypothetical protein [Planctomycetota bacterium]